MTSHHIKFLTALHFLPFNTPSSLLSPLSSISSLFSDGNECTSWEQKELTFAGSLEKGECNSWQSADVEYGTDAWEGRGERGEERGEGREEGKYISLRIWNPSDYYS